MKFRGKIKSIKYIRYSQLYLCPGALYCKMYLARNNKIQIDHKGIWDWKRDKYRKEQPRPFLATGIFE